LKLNKRKLCAKIVGPDLKRVEHAVVIQNTPLWFGEWAISTGFPATDKFMRQWADAQKLMYSQSAGWIVSLHIYTEIRFADRDNSIPAVLELQN
jgi:hypothetical protein